MKAKADKKARKTGLTSVESVIQPSHKKAQKTTTTNIHKQSEIEIHHWLNYNSDRVGNIIQQLENIQTGLKQVASLVRAHYILK